MPANLTFDAGVFDDVFGNVEAQVKVGLSQGIDRMVTEAKHLAPVGETAHLKGSIMRGEIAGSFKTGDLHGFLIATAPSAEAQEFGSGLHGERGAKYEIAPKNKKSLRWPIAGFVGPLSREAPNGSKRGNSGYGFSRKVMHPGVRAKAYLQGGAEAGATFLSETLADAVVYGLGQR